MDEQETSIVRPKINISTHGARKLKSLGYDPMATLINLESEINDLLAQELGKRRPSSIAISKFLDTKRFIATELLRYKYGRVPEVKPEDKPNNVKEPFRLILEG